ncbi:MAG: response regulator, partial [Calditrichia bacterium]|nr:response regulator [Calditrichia bacterium]
FEPFFTTKDKGTGLGLAVAHGLIKQHNGWITVKSKPDEGSELEFFIPVHNEPQEKTSKKPDDAEIILNGSNETILYIEDEISIRKIVGSALNKHNYNVISASNYEEAKNLFYKNKEKIDLIFSDIFLFESSALDLLDELTIPENIKVILTSGYTGNEEIWDKIVKKNIPFIQKPFPVNSLLKLIQETLHN